MRRRTRHLVGGAIVLVLVGLVLGACVRGCTGAATEAAGQAGAWIVPRTADGKPDLQGNWTNETQTPLERLGPPGETLTTRTPPPSNSGRRSSRSTAIRTAIRTAPRRPRAAEGGRLDAPGQQSLMERISKAAGGAVGGYNGFWLDPGANVMRIDGVARSSIIIGPPNGRMPPLTEAGKPRLAAQAERAKQFGESDHPEVRPLSDRCLVSFGSTPARRCCRTTSTTTTTRCADQRSPDDPERDGARRPHHPDRRDRARPAAGPALVRRLDRPLGRKYPGRRDHQHPPRAAPPASIL